MSRCGTPAGVEEHDRADEELCEACAEVVDGFAAWLELKAQEAESFEPLSVR